MAVVALFWVCILFGCCVYWFLRLELGFVMEVSGIAVCVFVV